MQPITRQGLRFIRTELTTGMTFARLASRTLDASRAARCKDHATEAYQSASRAAAKVEIDELDRTELEASFRSLRTKLEQLGVAV